MKLKRLILILVLVLAPLVVWASQGDAGGETVVDNATTQETTNEVATKGETQAVTEVSHQTEEDSHNGEHNPYAIVFLYIAVIIMASKFGGLVSKFGQPPVLGELLAGIVLGNLFLLGIPFLDPIKHNQFIAFLAEAGVVLLLFQIGLESNLYKMKEVGIKAFLVAIIGVVTPFVLGVYLVGPYFFPGQSFNVYLFLGATLTATSVGITARVFKDLGKIKTKESQIVLGAAVIDDVLGLLILAVVSAIVSVGSVSLAEIGFISAKAIIFLTGSIIIGLLTASHIGRLLSIVHRGRGMKVGLALTFMLVFAYLASLVGLAPIVGAFAAGLVLDPVHFKWFRRPKMVRKLQKISKHITDSEYKEELNKLIKHAEHTHVEDVLEDIALFLVPIFFVYTGMQVDLTTFINPQTLILALLVTLVAFIGKIVSGLGAGKGVNKWIIGIGMIPRGEVGLIFAAVGMTLGVISPSIYSVIVIMVIISTLVPPPILALLLKRADKKQIS